MPLYTLENEETGETKDEYMTYDESLKVERPWIVLPCTTAVGDPSVHGKGGRRRSSEFQRGVIDRIRKNVPGAKI